METGNELKRQKQNQSAANNTRPPKGNGFSTQKKVFHQSTGFKWMRNNNVLVFKFLNVSCHLHKVIIKKIRSVT